MDHSIAQSSNYHRFLLKEFGHTWNASSIFSKPIPFRIYPSVAAIHEAVSVQSMRDGIVGAGADQNGLLAKIKATSELIERCALQNNFISSETTTLRLSVNNMRQAGKAFVDPAELAQIDPNVDRSLFHLSEHSTEREYSWILGKKIIAPGKAYADLSFSGADIYVPEEYASFVNPELEGRIDFPLSTGTACHLDDGVALLGGILEVIERDAFAISWLYGLTGVNIIDFVDLNTELVGFLRSNGFEFQIKLLPSIFHAFVAVCVIQPSSDEEVIFPSVVVGAGSELTIDEAANKALVEAWMGLVWMLDLFERGECTKVRVQESVRHIPTPKDHAIYHAIGVADTSDRWFFGGDQSCVLTEENRHLFRIDERKVESTQLLHQLSELESGVSAIDLTPSALTDYHYSVFRVLIPEAMPLPRGIGFRHIRPSRTNAMLKAFANDEINFPNINPQPHPLP